MARTRSKVKKALSPSTKAKRIYEEKARGAKLGTGKRFAALSAALEAKGAENPNALAAWVGRRKYGKKRFQQLAAAGRKQGSKSGG